MRYMKTGKRVSVLGGINADITGVSGAPVRMATSNPGRVRVGAGGVGRNIAANLARLEVGVRLYGAVGDDAFGQVVLDETGAAGVDVHGVERIAPATGAYLTILDANGEMLISVADTAAAERLDEHYLDRHPALFEADLLVVDTNVSLKMFQHVLRRAAAVRLPVLVQPVSVTKAEKLLESGSAVAWATPNADELSHLVGEPLGELVAHPEKVAARLGACGGVAVTLGAEGAVWMDLGSMQTEHIPARVCRVVDVNGAGDAFTAGFCYGLLHGRFPRDACRLGVAAASLALQSESTVSELLNQGAMIALSEEPA